MKTVVLLFFASLLALTVQAAGPSPTPAPSFPEIKLSTGEVLKNVTLLSQTPTHVTFRLANGMRQVDKRQLPDDLQKLYPYDAQAAEQRKAALAEAEAKRLADLEAKKNAAAAGGAGSAKSASPVASRTVKKGVRISFVSDGDGSGPMISLVNETKEEQQFGKAEIVARMADDKVMTLRTATHGEKLEDGGAIKVIGDIIKVEPFEHLEFRGYFVANYQAVKHNVVEVYWAPMAP